MALDDYFSPDYATAKQRFAAACARLGFEHRALPIRALGPNSEPLTIDVGLAGAAKPTSAFVLSSGLHGVEAFFGSAVQLAFLDGLPGGWLPPPEASVILLHGLNPFGFAWRRRFNEDNVDLNRNFLVRDQPYSGAPPLTAAFRHVLAPRRSPARFTLSSVRIGYLAMRHGRRALWDTLPVGQYDFPDWLGFGGRGKSECAEILDRAMPPLLDSAGEVVHLDFHTGLGRWGIGQLLLPAGDPPEDIAWWRTHFGRERIESAAGDDRPYEIQGGLGTWLQTRFPRCKYRFATAEFGTYSPLHMLKAMTDEMRFHTQSAGSPAVDHWSRRRLSEAFVPRDSRWRKKTLEIGLELSDRSMRALWSETAAPTTITSSSNRKS
jgi:Protein of unknown function (DUF2817)